MGPRSHRATEPILGRASQAVARARRIVALLLVIAEQRTEAEQEYLVGLPRHSESTGWTPVGLVAHGLGRQVHIAGIKVASLIRKQHAGRDTVAERHRYLGIERIVGAVPRGIGAQTSDLSRKCSVPVASFIAIK